MREGCYLCHSQMIRALRAETQRYGAHFDRADSVYDRPFQWGSKRTGPDLARVGGKYSDAWQRLHLVDPRAVVPESNMPAYPWLARRASTAMTSRRGCARCARSATRIPTRHRSGAKAAQDKTELDALVAYLQGLGVRADVAQVAVAP